MLIFSYWDFAARADSHIRYLIKNGIRDRVNNISGKHHQKPKNPKILDYQQFIDISKDCFVKLSISENENKSLLRAFSVLCLRKRDLQQSWLFAALYQWRYVRAGNHASPAKNTFQIYDFSNLMWRELKEAVGECVVNLASTEEAAAGILVAADPPDRYHSSFSELFGGCHNSHFSWRSTRLMPFVLF